MKTNVTYAQLHPKYYAPLIFWLTTLIMMPGTNAQHVVQVYYLYTNEYSPDQDEIEGVKAAMLDVQAWYQIATGGRTFIIENPDEPIVLALQQNSAYYFVDYVGRIYNEIFVNGPLDDEIGELKVFFVKGGGGMAAGGNGCGGSCGIAWIGMDIFPEFNTGMYFDCPPGTGGQAFPCTPRGALAHELGHAFGMPHPFDTYPLEIALHSVMQAHWLYPYYYAVGDEGPWSLLSVERQFLQSSPFLLDTEILIPQPYPEMPVCNLPDNGAVPEAEYSYSVDGSEVTFYNTTEGAVLYYWTFGNGDVSTEENPVYTFDADGIYDVRLRATGANGMMDLALLEVAVCNMNTTITSTETTICSGEEVVITATGGSQYKWNTGANTSTIVTDPFETYDYIVTITAANGCTAIETITIYVDQAPEVEISTNTNDNKICIGGSLTLETTGFGEYLWSTNETDEEITVSPLTNTLYSVTVTDDNGCTGADNIIVEVFSLPVANIVPSVTQLCPGDTVMLTASGGNSYLWSTGQTTAQILATPDTTMLFSVTVMNGVGIGCEDDASIEIMVWPQAHANIDAPSHSCEGDSITFTGSGNGHFAWSTGDTTAQIVQYMQSDTTISLVVTTSAGCTDQDTAVIILHTLPSVLVEISDDSLCLGETVMMTAPIAVEYHWSTGDSTITILYTVEDAQEVLVTVIDSNQCAYHLSAGYYVYPSTNFAIDGPSGICEDDTIVLHVPDGFLSYQWSTGSDTSFVELTMAGLITVAVLDSFSCTLTKSIEIMPDDTRDLHITGEGWICEGDTTRLEVSDAYIHYGWSTGQDTNSIAAFTRGLYHVTVTGQFGCMNSDTVVLEVDSLPRFELMLVGSELIPTGLPAEPFTYLWSDNSTGAALNVLTSGIYCLTVTNELGCSFSSCQDVIISSTEVVPSLQIKIFPNPFSDEVYIEGALADEDEIIITDILGKQKKINLLRLANGAVLQGMSNWPSGMYFIHVLRNKEYAAKVSAVKL